MAGAEPISELIEAMVAYERTLVPPTAYPKVLADYDELNDDPGVYPAALHVPRFSVRTVSASSTRAFRHTIDLLLIFGRDAKYATREQRAWVPVILDGYDVNVNLNTRAQVLNVARVNYDPVIINDNPYVAITFEIEIEVSEPFTFGVQAAL
jgi:hypothetical protein